MRRRPLRAVLTPVLCLVVLVAAPAAMLPAGAQPDSQSDRWSVDGLVDKATGSTTTTKPPPTTTTTRPRSKPPGTTTAPPPASTPPSSSTAPTSTPGSPTASAPAAGASPAGAQAGQPGGPPPPPASSPGASGTVGPGGSAGPPSGFGGGQLLRLLQESVARRQRLDGRLRELQERMGRLEADVAAAQAALQAAQSDQQDVVARAAATSLALARTEGELHRAVEGTGDGSPRPEMPSLRPIGILQPGLLSLPAAAPTSAARPGDPDSPGVDELLAWQRELTDQARRQADELVGAQGRTAAADQAFGAALAPLEAERAVLAELRRELSAALSDPAVMLQGRSLSGTEMARPSAFALTDIPNDYLTRYQRASATCPGLSWTVLAAIGSIESSHGRSTAPGVREGANFAGAMGPMQFLGPTWAAYGADGNADGKRDVYLADDAVFGAANYLCASGAGDPARLPDAIWAYNHADWYVDQVLVLALRYGAGGLELVEASAADVTELLANPNLTLTPNARADLRNGAVDQRLVNVLAAATANHRISVSVIKTGHSEFVAGTDRISNHFHGRGVDITAVDGVPVTASNDRALDLALAILTASPSLRPDELGSPWPGLSEFPGAFSDAAHQDHLHLGWR